MGKLFFIAIAVILPILLLLYAIYRRKWVPFILGVAAFTVSQIFIRIPILNYLAEKSSTYQIWSATKPIVILLFLALSAGIAEEMARWLAIRFIMKRRSIHSSIIFGFGHGGIEALLLVGLPSILNGLATANSFELYMSSFERLCALLVHVCLSVIIMLAVRKKAFQYVLYAILIHSFINFSIVLASRSMSIVVAEIIFGMVTAAFVVITYIICRRFLQNEKNIYSIH